MSKNTMMFEIVKAIENEIYRYSWEDRTGVQVISVNSAVDIAKKHLRNYFKSQKEKVEVVHCKDCKYHQSKFYKDKRYKEGGYWCYWCELNSDPFENHSVNGQPNEFCSSAEMKEE